MRRLPYLHIILFLVTFLSTLFAGAVFQKGINPIKEPARIIEGLPFSLSIMLILLSHELSHYFLSKRHNTKATLPYFIPGPTIIGTFGAVIKMKSPILTRKALIDIGASGPIGGFIISVIATVIGLSQSKVIEAGTVEGIIGLGDSLIFATLSELILGRIPEGSDVLLHPVAFAGWVGLFITSLNLLPIGQLDGGHIAYAFLGERHRVVSSILVVVLSLLGLLFWEGWILWAVLMIVLGLRHPPVMDWETPLDPSRTLIGVISLFIFIVTFTPSPFLVTG